MNIHYMTMRKAKLMDNLPHVAFHRRGHHLFICCLLSSCVMTSSEQSEEIHIAVPGSGGQEREEGINSKMHEKLLRAKELFYILTVVVIIQLHTITQIHPTGPENG